MVQSRVKQRKAPPVKALDIFVWQGVNRKGKKINGELSAKNLLEVKSQLRKQGITPGKVKKKAKALFGGSKDKKLMPSK